MGVLLLVAAVIMVARVTGIRARAAATRSGLAGARLAIGLAGNFVLGALMTLGIGLYAPCMILVALLGMNDDRAFPIMMGSCAFLMPAASRPLHPLGALRSARGARADAGRDAGRADRRPAREDRCRSTR